jgi:hypothetical protein
MMLKLRPIVEVNLLQPDNSAQVMPDYLELLAPDRCKVEMTLIHPHHHLSSKSGTSEQCSPQASSLEECR